ncbi:unnamed protein product [Penicillium salamii]|uniref:Uncharacterized protein n=1 Tax=Penicillium salamii TaxID=1612424 RepID=A0A9W4IPH2_9EURO|nr:unnamed protein product [Penicillium salamii]CAG8036370.1 unnamed protein product [Penicillium salamii]CAG8058323.1 unnamed protein product [Penicillium salamii]CAG8086206.1 unnamed protein product [Penicillium salamii]CAG8094326.1 unnamed protein product [Penicillium salamii]
MVLNLLSRSLASSVSPGKRNIAIAEIVIYSLIHITQFSTRFLQERHYWHHTKNKGIGRCIFYSWFSMVGLLSQSELSERSKVCMSKRTLLTRRSSHSWLSFGTRFFPPKRVIGHCRIRHAKRGPLASFV